MKKIIAILALSLAFSYNAKAQETLKAAPQQSIGSAENSSSKETDMKMKALKNMDQLTATIGKLEDGLKADLTSLLIMRNEAVSNATSEEEKKSLFNRFTSKFLGGLTPEQLEKLKNNKELYISLTEYKKN